MAGKTDSKKGPSKKALERIYQLRAVETLYKALCRKYGALPFPPFVSELSARCEDGKPLEKILLSSTQVGAAHARICMDLLGGYAATKNVAFWGCSVGDEGLMAIADQLRASVDTWFQGSKILSLEIIADGSGYLSSRWTGLPNAGSGMEMPSLVQGDVPVISYDSAAMIAQLQGNDGCSDQPPFSLASLEHFSLCLGVRLNPLKVLVLDHNRIGESGFAVLSSGLKRMAALESLSLSFCGLGPRAAALISNILLPDEKAHVALMQPRLKFLNLSGNKLEGQGLINLCLGLHQSETMTSLGLAEINITEEHLEAIQALARAMAVNTSFTHLDLSRNFIGDDGVAPFIAMLPLAPHVKSIQISCRTSLAVGKQLHAALGDNNGKKKGGVKKKKSS